MESGPPTDASPQGKAPTEAGSYAVVASLDNPNYAADDATGTLVIDPITPVYNARIDAAHLPSNKYLVEAVGLFQTFAILVAAVFAGSFLRTLRRILLLVLVLTLAIVQW